MSKKKSRTLPKVNAELEGFNISINTNGEIISTHSPEELNKFLNRHVDDKKLRDRDDID